MDDNYRSRLEKNIGKYSWYRVFTKRVFLPLIAIHLVNVGKLSIGQLAFIAGASSLIQLILQVPAGYIADKWGNKPTLIIGALIGTVSPLFYIFMPNFIGGLLAASLFFAGYSFQSGAIEAFMHDTLTELGKEKEYAKVMGRAQSYGLIGNVFLLTLIPATYTINHNLPFWLGFLSLAGMLWLTIRFTYPVSSHTDSKRKNPFAATRSVVTARNIALFIFAGALTGVMHRGDEFRELVYQDIGINVAYFGMLLALSSIVGAIMGRYIHVLDKVKPLTFYFFDLSFIAACLVVVGGSRHPLPVIIGFTLFLGYARVRLIIFQAKLLHNLQHTYKATLISALNLFSVIGEVGAIALLARLIGFHGYTLGHLLFGICVFGIGLPLWIALYVESRKNLLSNSSAS